MECELYRKRSVWTRSYVVPVYLYGPIYGYFSRYTFGENNTSGAVVAMALCGVVQVFMFLSSFWGHTMYKFANLQRAKSVKEATTVLVKKEQGVGRGRKIGFAELRRDADGSSVERSRSANSADAKHSSKSVHSDTKSVHESKQKSVHGGSSRSGAGTVEEIVSFEFDNDTYYFERKEIRKLEVDVSHTFAEYASSEMDGRRMYRKECERMLMGKNEFKVSPPTFMRMFAEHAVSPFFVFQVFCVLLWMLDEYWKYSLFTFTVLIFFEAGMVFQRLTNIRQVRSMNLKKQKITRMKNMVKEEVESTELYPGDRIVIETNIQVPADLLVVKGGAVVNESMLSGEATPVTKESIPRSKDVFVMGKHKKHVLYGGTKILKIPEQRVECIVLRTGFMTEQGELIKTMVASEDVVSENNYEAYMFIGAMLVFAVASCVYVIKESMGMGKTVYKTALECIMILTNVVPPELPMELTIAVNSSLQELVTLGVYCLEPFRIPFAGRVTVCCFDKTGTLTELNFQLERLEHETEESAKIVLSTCHSAIILEEKVEGDPLDICSIEHAGAELVTDSVVKVSDKKYEIVKRYTFESELKRATGVIKCENQYYVVMKGAPETVCMYLEEMPEGYYAEFESYAEKGYKVLALAMKKITGIKDVSGLQRSVVEKNMVFAGFALYNSKLKEGAKSTIKQLAESDHKIIMITGDNEKTAISVAKNVGMYNGHYVTGTEQIDAFLHKATELGVEERHTVVWPSVFARANPEGKEKIVALLNMFGEYTLMCGDGTNDVGALKTAHVGIALLEQTKAKAKSVTLPGNIGQTMFILDEEVKLKLGDASVAAPFTSRTGSLQSVIDVISRGRSALVSTVQMYKVLALNCLLSAYTLSVFDTMGIKYGDYQMTAAGILSSFSFTFFGKSRPLSKLSKEKPVAKIFSKYIVSSVVLQTLTHIGAFYVIYRGIIKFEKIMLHEKFAPNLGNTCMFLLACGLQVTTLIVNYVGRPFRENLMENVKLFNSLGLSVAMVVVCTLELVPELNSKMELVHIPVPMKVLLLATLASDFVVCTAIEKLAFALFMKKTPVSVTKQKKEQ